MLKDKWCCFIGVHVSLLLFFSCFLIILGKKTTKDFSMCLSPLQDVDECSPSSEPCGPGHLCVNSPGSFRCECKAGYYFDGISRTCVGMWASLQALGAQPGRTKENPACGTLRCPWPTPHQKTPGAGSPREKTLGQETPTVAAALRLPSPCEPDSPPAEQVLGLTQNLQVFMRLQPTLHMPKIRDFRGSPATCMCAHSPWSEEPESTVANQQEQGQTFLAGARHPQASVVGGGGTCPACPPGHCVRPLWALG